MTKANRLYPLAALVVLASCGDSHAVGDEGQSGGSATPSIAATDQPVPKEAAEQVLFAQLSCRQPAQAGIVISAMLRSQTLRKTEGGGDGIRLFAPAKPMTFLGHEVVRLGGWQANPSGGAMAPFSRGPGTAPPNHISVTVRGTVEQLRHQFARLGVPEAKYSPDLTREAWVATNGEIIQPRRQVPGPQFEVGDNDLATHPIKGTVTISCTADEMDFQRDIEARLSGS